MPVGAETVSASGDECDSEPACPFMLTFATPTAAFAAAVNVIDCAVPGVRVSVDGEAVTPAGSPAIETLTVPLKPLTAVAETATCWPEAPVVIERLAGLTLSEKSGTCAAAMLSVTVVL